VLRDLQHLHGKNAKAILLELFNDVAHGTAANRVGLDDSECPLQSLHKFDVGPYFQKLNRLNVSVFCGITNRTSWSLATDH
jgi:hypothetical protein